MGLEMFGWGGGLSWGNEYILGLALTVTCFQRHTLFLVEAK